MAEKGSISQEQSLAIRKKIQSEFAQKMEAGGISDEVLIDKLKEEPDASLPKLFQFEGHVIESREIPV
jgi:hypothetical protein